MSIDRVPVYEEAGAGWIFDLNAPIYSLCSWLLEDCVDCVLEDLARRSVQVIGKVTLLDREDRDFGSHVQS